MRGIRINFREIDFLNSEHMSEAYTKVNERIFWRNPFQATMFKATPFDRSIRLKRFRPWSTETSWFVTGMVEACKTSTRFDLIELLPGINFNIDAFLFAFLS